MTYKKLNMLTSDGQIYENPALGTIEAMLPTGGYKSAHAPAILELDNNDLLIAWFAGSFEGGTDVNIICSKLEYGADKWSEPILISKDNNRSNQNPSLFLGPDNSIWAMYTSQKGREEGIDNMQFTSQIRRQKSYDGGSTWEEYDTIFPEEGTFARQAIQVLSNGRWIYGNWICTNSSNGLANDPSAFKISDDQGKTWKHIDMPESNGCVHPTIVEINNGHLIAFMRSRKADNIYKSESFDFGNSWSKPIKTVLPNNNSSISAIKLQSGRIAIAYNPTSAATLNGVNWPGLRCPVAVALSEDNGKTFPLIRNIELGEGYVGDENKNNNLQYEYPSIIQSKDGTIHLTYAYRSRLGIKWVKFTEKDVIGNKRGNSIYNPTSGEGIIK